jgi:hypothetical protein
MQQSSKILITVLWFLICADATHARMIIKPQEYGRVIINNYAGRAGLAPVVFDHWLHRAQFTCRLCRRYRFCHGGGRYQDHRRNE